MLLGIRDVLDDHPRPALRYKVARMKPFWKAGQDSYHWIREDNLRKVPQRHVGRQVLLVGPAAVQEDEDEDTVETAAVAVTGAASISTPAATSMRAAITGKQPIAAPLEGRLRSATQRAASASTPAASTSTKATGRKSKKKK
jgi:hypothetical protein